MITKVFFGPIWSASKWAMYDIVADDNIEYCDFDEGKLNRVKRAFLSRRIQKHLPTRMQIILYRLALKYKFFRLGRKSKILFVFCDAYNMFANGEQVFDFVRCLKAHYVNAKFVCYKYETINELTAGQVEKRPLFDLFLTFNRIDAEKYNIEYYGGICECGTVEPAKIGETYDLVYCGSGAAITRARIAMDIFKCLSDKGWKCIFYLPGMRDVNKDYCEKELGKIEQIEGSWGPRSGKVIYKNSVLYADYPCYYQTNIALINNSKAVLELIIPKGLASCTMRLSQVMSRNKKLITNSITVTKEPFYNKNNIQYFENAEDIDKSFLDSPFVPFDYDFSGVGFVNLLCKRLYPEEF